jgi:hypothetical protein
MCFYSSITLVLTFVPGAAIEYGETETCEMEATNAHSSAAGRCCPSASIIIHSTIR